MTEGSDRLAAMEDRPARPGARHVREGASQAPPGWPADLAAPGDPEFAERAGPWLLDRLPGTFRSERALRTRPLALAQLAADVTAAQVEGTRHAYSRARVRLDEAGVPADGVQAVLESLSRAGRALAQTHDEIVLVLRSLERQSDEEQRAARSRPAT